MSFETNPERQTFIARPSLLATLIVLKGLEGWVEDFARAGQGSAVTPIERPLLGTTNDGLWRIQRQPGGEYDFKWASIWTGDVSEPAVLAQKPVDAGVAVTLRQPRYTFIIQEGLATVRYAHTGREEVLQSWETLQKDIDQRHANFGQPAIQQTVASIHAAA